MCFCLMLSARAPPTGTRALSPPRRVTLEQPIACEKKSIMTLEDLMRVRARLWICNTIAISILVSGCEHAITRVLPSLSYTQITAGQSHACALVETGEAYCWGGPGPQLGIGPSYAG